MKNRHKKLAKGYVKKIHVNQRIIKNNTKTGEEVPPCIVQTSSGPLNGTDIAILVDGKVVARLKYRPQNPLGCGARLWLETKEEVVIDG